MGLQSSRHFVINILDLKGECAAEGLHGMDCMVNIDTVGDQNPQALTAYGKEPVQATGPKADTTQKPRKGPTRSG